MTRAEFANRLVAFGKKTDNLKEGEPLKAMLDRVEFKAAQRAYHSYDIVAAAIDVATNGFDPEPMATVDDVINWAMSTRSASERLERAQESAKRSRPFVGSHKLPVDLDWD